MRFKYGKHILAVGLTTLLITSAASFAANAQPKTEYKSYAEAEYVAAIGSGLDLVVDPLVDNAIESRPDPGQGVGAQACHPTQDACDDSGHTESPVGDALAQLTGPLGDQIGAQDGTGVIGDYAKATQNKGSQAASGLVTSEGAIQTGTDWDPSHDNARLDLSENALNQFLQTDQIGNVSLDIGAVSSKANLDKEGKKFTHDYAISGGTVTLSSPLLGDLLNGLTGAVKDLPTELDLGLNTLCELPGTITVALSRVLEALSVGAVTGLSDAPSEFNPCESIPEVPGLDIEFKDMLNVKVSGLDNLTKGLTNITHDGITLNVAEGTLTIDLADAAEALLGQDINSLPENTDLLNAILTKLPTALNGLVGELKEQITAAANDLNLEVTLGGQKIPGLSEAIDQGSDAFGTLIDTLLGGLEQGVDTASGPLEDLFDVLTEQGLSNLVQLIVNVPDKYAEAGHTREGGLPGGVNLPFAATGLATQNGDTDGMHSITALEVAVGPDAAAADILLGNALVGPNSPDTQADADAEQDADANADADSNADANADADNNADNNADTDAAADQNADTNAAADANAAAGNNISDADAAADADTSSALPATGAESNLWPFWLLGLGLVLFGVAAMVNEKRRLI